MGCHRHDGPVTRTNSKFALNALEERGIHLKIPNEKRYRHIGQALSAHRCRSGQKRDSSPK